MSSRRRRDHRPVAIGILVSGVLVLGWVITEMPDKVDLQDPPAVESATAVEPNVMHEPRVLPSQPLPDLGNPADDPEGHVAAARKREIAIHFNQSTTMLHIGDYESAFAALHKLLQLAPRLPEAHVNMGFALLGVERFGEAWDFFNTATLIRPGQANAYYGMALALDAQGERRAALESMRTYLHLEKQDQAYLRKAQSAVWEWEAQLGIGPWGETRGIPPGYTEEQLRRDPSVERQQILVRPAAALEAEQQEAQAD